MDKVISLSAHREMRQARLRKVRGELNDDQLDAICALMRKLLKEKQTNSICEACDIATERLGF